MIEEQQRIDELARAALEPFGLDPNSTVTLCNVSENHTYRVEEPSSGRGFALRVHRPGYRNVAQIESELVWLDALRDDEVVETPPAVRAPDGRRVISVEVPDLGARNVVVFDWLPGTPPDLDAGHAAIGQFKTLGSISARMHRHVREWHRPADFARPRWDYDYSIGPLGHWGPWRDGLGIGPEELALLERLEATVAARLERYGQDESRFGLVHADFRLANLLVDGDRVVVIDFDDCGFSWYMYDFATTITFIEEDPRVPEWREAWVEGYRSVADLEPAAEAELETFVMMRRLLIVAWIGSHHMFAPEAAELGVPYTNITCQLAEDYLSTHATR
ncbi:MAG TPA: phosphotransferase [Solirubrobacteraceae bacterium]|nr:phosphotransferase [Solirubrobacteraceae bacterium]